jgi:hypothetical protein
MRATLPLLPLLFACSFAAAAQSFPPAPMGPGPMGPGGVPSVAVLAMAPGLSVQQQQQLRQLLIQRRDAHEALRQRERAENDKIDADSDNRIRSLLGEQAYVRYVKWTMGPGPRGAGGRDAPPPHDDLGDVLPPELEDDQAAAPPAASH